MIATLGTTTGAQDLYRLAQPHAASGGTAGAPTDAFDPSTQPDVVGYNPTRLGGVLMLTAGAAATTGHFLLIRSIVPQIASLAVPSGMCLGLLAACGAGAAMAAVARKKYNATGQGTMLMTPAFQQRDLGPFGVKEEPKKTA
ncbi:MAG: hypothetical protein FJX76_16115 [Armatimonadetes bacterium]|nr:hypothetical protein [Armatimonadota bacterium]